MRSEYIGWRMTVTVKTQIVVQDHKERYGRVGVDEGRGLDEENVKKVRFIFL